MRPLFTHFFLLIYRGEGDTRAETMPTLPRAALPGFGELPPDVIPIVEHFVRVLLLWF